MYAPRHHYRRLLLLPDWVALGFPLLLGCQVLLAHAWHLHQQTRPEGITAKVKVNN